MKALIAVLAIFSVSTFAFAYADEVPFPVLPTDNWTGTDVKVFYPTNSTYIVQISVHYSVESPLEILDSVTWYDITGQTHTIEVSEKFNLKYFPAVEVPELDPRVDQQEVDRILQEKKDEVKATADNGFTKLRQCLVEFEEQQPVRFEAWKRTATLSEFTIPDEWINADTYSRAEKEAQKKWTICEALKKYEWIGVYEANKGIDVHDPTVLDISDSPDTVPITAEMIQTEIKKAQDYQCSFTGKSMGLCVDHFTGVNRGDPDGYHLPFWYGEYKQQQKAEQDELGQVDKALQMQCQVYYPLYEHKDGTDQFPEWLGHCSP